MVEWSYNFTNWIYFTLCLKRSYRIIYFDVLIVLKYFNPKLMSAFMSSIFLTHILNQHWNFVCQAQGNVNCWDFMGISSELLWFRDKLVHHWVLFLFRVLSWIGLKTFEAPHLALPIFFDDYGKFSLWGQIFMMIVAGINAINI